jgi:NAD+ kinase
VRTHPSQDDLVARTKKLEMPAVALTDHGNLYGAIDFYMAAKKAKLKAILGCEVYLATGSGGILGYSQPERPICHIRIEQLIPPHFDEGLSFAIILGGDGTVLSAFRQLAPQGIPALTVNTGHMGFLTETYGNHLFQVLEELLKGNYQVEERSMLTVQLFRQEELLWEALSLNEVVVHREPLTSMCHFEIQIGLHAPVDLHHLPSIQTSSKTPTAITSTSNEFQIVTSSSN